MGSNITFSFLFACEDTSLAPGVGGRTHPLSYPEIMLPAVILLAGALAATAAPAPQKAFPFPYDQHDFSNGLRLITVPTEYPNVVALYIVVSTGSRNEVEPGKSGFAHLFEHMMFRGTKLFPPEKYEAALKEAGAASNAYTTDDFTAYHTTFSKEDLEGILRMEADRFQHLEYSEPTLRTESLAVLGEYNKNSVSPISKLFEALFDTAYDRHTYKHTTMGFLKDIQDMPNQYEYSKQFFDRYYRPEYTTIIVAGDVQPQRVRAQVEKYWGNWKRGNYRPEVPPEPRQQGPRANHVAWPSPTLPWLAVSFKGPGYSDTGKDYAALDLLGFLGFSESSALYQKLVIEEQKVDTLDGDISAHVDPYLFSVLARVKKPAEVDYVRDRIIETLAGFKDNLVAADRLDAVKKHLRYSFALRMNNSEAVAATLARFVGLRRTPETINRIYDTYQSVTPEDIRAAARKFFQDDGRTIVTLTGPASPAADTSGEADRPAAAAPNAPTSVVALPGKSPLVTFRIVFRTGAASDPAGKDGVASLTAAMLAEGGTREMSYQQVVDAMFPMATSVSHQVDKEMTVFAASTHVDNLDAFYKLLRAMLLDPGWRADDFERLRDDAVNYLRVSLRGNNDEELGKEVLYNTIYSSTSYGHNDTGKVSAIEKLTIDDLQQFYKNHYTKANLTIGISGGYPPEFLERIRKDFAALPVGKADAIAAPKPKSIEATHITIVEKQTRSVAYSIRYPIDVRRGDPDYPALLLAQSYLGQHRNSGGRLYSRIRQERGLNYGDYAYIEYFPRGMFQFEPSPNLARGSQIFQIWIRPVEPPTAVFTLRLALYELDRLVNDGLSQEDFQRTRSFLTKYVNLLTRTKSAELGYAIDSRYYGIPEYNGYLKAALAKLTRDQVNQAIRRHLRPDRLEIVAVSANAEELKKKIESGAPSPMTYNSPKRQEILDEDKAVEKWPLKARITIVPVEKVFE